MTETFIHRLEHKKKERIIQDFLITFYFILNFDIIKFIFIYSEQISQLVLQLKMVLFCIF